MPFNYFGISYLHFGYFSLVLCSYCGYKAASQHQITPLFITDFLEDFLEGQGDGQ